MVRRRRRAATLARLACSVPSAVRSRFGLAPATSCSSTSSNSSAANASAAVMVFVHWCSRQRVARQDASLADLRRPCASARRYRPNRRLEPPALEAALRQLRLRWNVGKCGFLVPRLGLDDLPFPDNLNIRASLASLRIPFSAEEADVFWRNRFYGVQNRLVRPANRAKQNHAHRPSLLFAAVSTLDRSLLIASSSAGKSSATTLHTTSKSTER